MDRINPVCTSRATTSSKTHCEVPRPGDFAPFHKPSSRVVTDPFTARDGHGRFGEPAPEAFNAGFRTFCGT